MRIICILQVSKLIESEMFCVCVIVLTSSFSGAGCTALPIEITSELLGSTGHVGFLPCPSAAATVGAVITKVASTAPRGSGPSAEAFGCLQPGTERR